MTAYDASGGVMEAIETRDVTDEDIDLAQHRVDTAVHDSRDDRVGAADIAVHVDVEEGSAGSATSGTNDYVVPIVHARMPEPIMNVVSWTALGTLAVLGAVDLPVAGVLAVSLLVIRNRHGRNHADKT